MSTSNLSAAANDTLQSCSQTAQALIGVCRSGGNRVIGRVDAGWDGLVARHGARLSEQLRHDLVAAQREVTGLYAKGIDALTTSSTHAVQAVVNTATASVKRLSGRVAYLEAPLAPLPLASAIIIVQPIAVAGRDVAGFVAERAGRGEAQARTPQGRCWSPRLTQTATRRPCKAPWQSRSHPPPSSAGGRRPHPGDHRSRRNRRSTAARGAHSRRQSTCSTRASPC